MEEQIPLKEKVDKLYSHLGVEEKEKKAKKIKKIKIPRKARVSKGKFKKGWVGILKLDENGNISGEKQQIIDSTIRLKNADYHATDGREIVMWEGKYPVVVQPSWTTNPINFKNLKEGKENEVYGKKYIMARMMGDLIKVKAKQTGILVIILIIAGIAFGVNYFFGA